MAYRDSTVAVSSVNVSNIAVTAPAALAVNDVVVGYANWDSNGTYTIGLPSGFTALASSGLNSTFDGENSACGYKVESGSLPANYTFTSTTANDCVAVVSAYSGIDTANPLHNSSGSNSSSSHASPASIAVTGFTTTTVCDLVYVGIPDWNSAGASHTFTAPSGFTTRQSGVSTNLACSFLADQVAFAAGPTGTVTGTATASAGQCGFMGYLLALKATVAPVISRNPDSAVVAEGTAVTLVAAATGAADMTAQWQDNSSGSFADITGATDVNGYSFTATYAMRGRQYRVVYTDSNGSTTSSAATLIVNAVSVYLWDTSIPAAGDVWLRSLGAPPAGGPAYAGTVRGSGVASSAETTARLDTGTTRATGAAAATETTARIAAASTTGTGRAAGTGAKGVAWAATGTATGKAATTESKGASASIVSRGTGVGSATGLHGAAFAGTTTGAGRGSDSYTVASVRSSSATATGGGAATGAGLHATAQSGLARAGGRVLAAEATARTAAGVTLATGKATATETTARTAAGTIKAAGLVADSYSVAFIRATFGTATGGGRATASGLHAVALQGLTRAGGKVTGAALHAVALGAIVKGGGTVAAVGAKASAWSATVRGGGFADDSYLINHIDYGRAPAGGRAFHMRDADTARPHEAETERPAVISGTRAGNINTARPANRGGRRP